MFQKLIVQQIRIDNGSKEEGSPEGHHPRGLRRRKDLPDEPIRQQEVFQSGVNVTKHFFLATDT